MLLNTKMPILTLKSATRQSVTVDRFSKIMNLIPSICTKTALKSRVNAGLAPEK